MKPSRHNATELLPKATSKSERIWFKEEVEPMLAGTYRNGISIEESGVASYKDMVTKIMRYNCKVAKKDPSAHRSLSKNNDDQWLREHIQDRWARRSETRAWQDFEGYKSGVEAANRARIDSGEPLSRADEKWEQVTEKKRKRAANKKMWEECEAVVLEDWKKETGQDYEDKIQELLDLQTVVDIQKAELNARTKTLPTLVSEASSQTGELTGIADSHLHIVDTEVDTTKALLDLSGKSMRRLQTRISRLSAKDVMDAETRKVVMQERLAHPEALKFMFQGRHDLEAAKAIASSTKRLVENMEDDLERVSLAAMDTVTGLKDAILAMDLRG